MSTPDEGSPSSSSPSSEPDLLEKSLRFGCGFAAGALLAFLVAVRVLWELNGPFWALVPGAAFLSGYLALRHGDEFWYRFGRW